jgi:hypothetical protein
MNGFVSPLMIGVSVAAIALIMAFVGMRSRRRVGAADLGEVSNQWMMEHRSGAGQDQSRWTQR